MRLCWDNLGSWIVILIIREVVAVHTIKHSGTLIVGSLLRPKQKQDGRLDGIDLGA